ncbi:MAG: TonB-dependent receptor [Dysgonamonadaceae bacterium]|jgi:iron complex outermembrane receptor protein|nr:TonB-dependent receptor [Dysgonamonadaceae bacterium]
MKQKLFLKDKAYRFKRFTRKAYSVFNSMHKVVSIGVISGTMLTFVHSTESTAQTPSSSVRDSISEQDLDEITVTAAKAELTLKQAAKLVTVITKEEIARQPVQSIQDLLKTVAGVDVRQRGGNGVQSDISVRGGTFDQIAVLLNGANLTNPHTGHYSFDLPVNLSDIERIEIIQGPSSLLYGASAFSGGINIITKKRSDSKAYFNLTGGMHELFGAEANGSLNSGSSSHQLSAGYNSSSGYLYNTDYKIFNSLWQSRFWLDQSKIDLQVGFNDKKYGAGTFYSGGYPDQYDDTRSLFGSIKGETGDQLKFIPQLYWNRHWDDFQLYRDGTSNIPSWYTGTNHHRSDVFGFNLNLQYKWKPGITNFGGEFRNEGILSNVLGIPLDKPNGDYTKYDNRSNIGYFLEHTFLLKKLTIGLGLLANYNTALHEDFSFFPNINAAYQFSGNLKFYASWNNALRMPTFTDLYYKDPTQIGNPDLLSEKSSGYEIGAKFSNSFLSLYLTGFYMRGKDIIDWVKKPEDELYQARNLSTLDKRGIETGLSIELGNLFAILPHTRLDAGYTYLNQSRDAGNLLSNYALDYLRHKLTSRLAHPVCKNLSAEWAFRWQDRMGSYTKYINYKKDSEEKYSAYSILDMRINWQLKDFKIHLIANNLFDVSYHDIGNVPQPGFWFSGGISYTIR